MPNSNAHQALVIKGRSHDVSQENGIVTGKGADILQATPREGCTIEIGQFRSEDTDTITITESDDIIELTLEDNLLLYTSVKRLQEEIIPAAQRGAKTGEQLLPARLSFTNQRSRGEDGLLIKTAKVLDIKGKLIDAAGKKSGQFAARKIAEKIEEHLVGPDILYQIVANGDQAEGTVELKPATEEDIRTSSPLLLFIHGTASSTTGSFSELWEPEGHKSDTVWQDLQKTYKGNIFALEHRTLTNSPIDNVVDLMEKLPIGCRLHLVSHSRGGLVGELLCRGQFNNTREPFTDEDIELFTTEKIPRLLSLFTETKKDYQHHQKQLRKLNTLLLDKQPIIERFVRVACPARGTTLASGKLDIYLSGILNVIGLIPALKVSPIYGLLKAFVLAVAKERTKPEQLPGLEAQMPGSPFIAMLNSAPESVKAHLAVIKGDIEPTGIFKKISLFFLDQFYESDHDLVVNTPSMDGGARREKQIPILFDQGNDINHFKYFENSRTREGLFAGLTDTALPPKGFQLEEQKAIEIARTLPMGRMDDQIASVFILPGLAGNHLKVDGDHIWINLHNLVLGQIINLNINAINVQPMQPVAFAYDALQFFLKKNHYNVIPLGYDWRLSVLETGRALGAAVDERLRNTKQPVHIIAHSMGGLVTRGMMSQCPEIWDRMRQRKGSRVLMLGTPNRGSYAIPRLFSRQERLLKLLNHVDKSHDDNELLNIFRRFPGVLELLPVTEKGLLDLGDSIWDEFGELLGKNWQRPTKTALLQAQKTWKKLKAVQLDPEVVYYVAGHARETPNSVKVKGVGQDRKEIHFNSTKYGDSLVPWATGIPKGIKHWYVSAKHGNIPNHIPAYKGFLEILETGSTNLLASQPPARGIEARKVMLPDSVDIFPDNKQLLAAGMWMDIDAKKGEQSKLPPLHVSIIHGNLRFAHSPLAVGHYQGDTIVSAEAVLDSLLDHRLTKRQQSGVYPGPLKTSEILFTSYDNDFPGAIIVGLGDVGELTPGTLTSSFRDAVIRYVLLGKETNQFKRNPIALSTLLIGTGAGELSAKDSISSLMRGVTQANLLLAGPTNNVDFIVSQLDIIELHADVAIAAQYALLDATKSVEFGDTITHNETIIEGNGGRTRAYFIEDAEWWQRLRIEVTNEGGLKYTTLGARARAEMRIQAIQRQSVEPFLKALTTQTTINENAGRVLFELLIPPELKNHAADNQRLMLVVDKGAASYPWELLEYSGRTGNEALAIKSGMIRQLVTQRYTQTNICTDHKALVIGDPLAGKDSPFSDLPGARTEALEVAKVLDKNRVQVGYPLIQESGNKILTKLMTTKFGILHLAGHGVVDYKLPEMSGVGDSVDSNTTRSIKVTGMLIGENHFLTPVEIRQMPITPAFVFINCCHLGKITGDLRPYMGQRYHLAANLATQFIEQGVKAVIAAGWAVNDAAALTFASSFYEFFLNGTSFGDAVQEARAATQNQHPNVNTWGAYQCYGDPDYRFTDSTGSLKRGGTQSFVSLAEYVVAVENIAKDATTASNSDSKVLTDRLRDILDKIPENYANDSKILAVTGDAWGELDHFEKAIEAYTSALQAQKAYAPIRCAEQLANLKCRRAVDNARTGELSKAINMTKEAIEYLLSLNKHFGENIERLSLLGSSYKRRAEIEVTKRTELIKNLENMRDYYWDSYTKSMELKGKVYSYPLINNLTARWLLNQENVERDNLNDFGILLEHAKQANIVPEINQEYFWQNIAVIDCDLLTALQKEKCTLEKVRSIADTYEKVGRVASSPRQMRSVVENVEFLSTITTELKIDQANNLQELHKHLKKLC